MSHSLNQFASRFPHSAVWQEWIRRDKTKLLPVKKEKNTPLQIKTK